MSSQNPAKGRRYLLDAPSYIQLLQAAPVGRVATLIRHSAMLDSTFSEVGRLIIRLCSSGGFKKVERSRLISAFDESLQSTAKLSVLPRFFGRVSQLAVKENLDFESASNIYAARRYRLILVTQSTELRRIASAYSRVIATERLLSQSPSEQPPDNLH